MLNYNQQEYVLILWAIWFWALVHATNKLRISREKKELFTRIDFLILFIICTFAWVVFWLVAMMVTDNLIQIILSSAIWAFLWLVWLAKIANILLDFIAARAWASLSSNKNNENDNN